MQQTIRRPIVIQGSMDIEIAHMIEALGNAEEVALGGYKFVKGTLDAYPVVISKTQVGMVNAAVATTLAIAKLDPLVIINQGTAGAHDIALHRGDIVLGVQTVNINAFISEWTEKGAGMHPEKWMWRATEIDRGEGFEKVRALEGSAEYLAIAQAVSYAYDRGNVVKGIIGSGDTWNREIDRINLIRAAFGTSAEDMETFSAAQVCRQMGVDFLGIRIISNSELHRENFEAQTGVDCQRYVLQVARAIVASLGSNQ